MKFRTYWTILFALALISVRAFAAENGFAPTLVTCGSFDEKEKPLAFVDFEIAASEGKGNPEKTLLKEYRPADFPLKNARTISNGSFQYRVSANAFENPSAPGQHFLLMTIYEEIPGGTLLQRAVQRRDFAALKNGFDLKHGVMSSKKTIACLAKLKPVKKESRVPAKSPKSAPKASSKRARR